MPTKHKHSCTIPSRASPDARDPIRSEEVIKAGTRNVDEQQERWPLKSSLLGTVLTGDCSASIRGLHDTQDSVLLFSIHAPELVRLHFSLLQGLT